MYSNLAKLLIEKVQYAKGKQKKEEDSQPVNDVDTDIASDIRYGCYYSFEQLLGPPNSIQ